MNTAEAIIEDQPKPEAPPEVTAKSLVSEIQIPDTKEVQLENEKISKITYTLEIKNHDDYLIVAEHGKRIALAQKNVKALFQDFKSKAKGLHDSACNLERFFLTPLNNEGMVNDQKIKTWLLAEQKRERDELEAAQKAADDLAKATAEKERKDQETERLKCAELLQAQGFTEEAEAVLDQPTLATPVVPVAVSRPAFGSRSFASPKAKGVTLRDNWGMVITNPMALLQEIVAGRQSIGLLFTKDPATGYYDLDDGGLQKMGKALKAETNIAGCRPINNQGVSKRTKGMA